MTKNAGYDGIKFEVPGSY